MFLFILLPVLVVFSIIVGFSSFTMYDRTMSDSKQLLLSEGENVAETLSHHLNQAMDVSRTVAQVFVGLTEGTQTVTEEQATELLKEVLTSNPSYASIWLDWEGKDFAQSEVREESFMPMWVQNNGEFKFELLNNVEINDQAFAKARANHEEFISIPHNYSYKNKPQQTVLSVASPIIVNGELHGYVGVHLGIDELSEFVETFTFYETGYAGIIAGDGTVVAHRDITLAGTVYFESPTIKNSNVHNEIEQAILSGESLYVQLFSEVIGKELYVSYYPFMIGKAETPWTIFVTAPIDEVTEQAKKIITLMVMTSIVAIVILATIIVIMTRNITRPILDAVYRGQKIADKDLREDIPSHQLNRKDEIGDLSRSFQTMIVSMREVMKQLKSGVEQVDKSADHLEEAAETSAKSANEIAVAIQKVSSLAEGQMQGASESFSALEEMSQGIQRVTKTTGEILDESNEMMARAKLGRSSVEKSVAQIDAIHESANESLMMMRMLKHSAEQINSILAMITNVSEQTNLLALNAAIEAARAGEAGQGFSIVAEEIRKLSNETNQSANAIHTLITEIQQGTEQMERQMEHNQLEVEEGKEEFRQVGILFNDMLTAINHVTSHIDELSAATEEMSAMSEEISAASQEMSHSARITAQQAQSSAASTEEQLATVEEIYASAMNLKNTVDELNRHISQFNL